MLIIGVQETSKQGGLFSLQGAVIPKPEGKSLMAEYHPLSTQELKQLNNWSDWAETDRKPVPWEEALKVLKGIT